MSATEDLRRLLDERGVPWKEHRHVMPGSMAIQRETLWGQPTDVASGKLIPHVYHYRATEMGDGRLFLEAQLISPEQVIAATLGDSDATGARRGDAGKVYLVEACDELIEDWFPLGVYLSREAAGKHAESLRGEVDGVMSFARVVEMEVLG